MSAASALGDYYAVQRIKVMRAGKVVWLDPGEAIPEAHSWANPKAWEDAGKIRFMPNAAFSPQAVPRPQQATVVQDAPAEPKRRGRPRKAT